jgi:protein SCO1/2
LVQPVFVSIDPARDTPEVLKSYVENFGPRLIGLTGTPDEIAAVAKAYRVYFAKAGNTPSATDYLMDHSSIIYLMGRDGQFVKHMPYTTDAAKLASDIKQALSTSP